MRESSAETTYELSLMCACEREINLRQFFYSGWEAAGKQIRFKANTRVENIRIQEKSTRNFRESCGVPLKRQLGIKIEENEKRDEIIWNISLVQTPLSYSKLTK